MYKKCSALKQWVITSLLVMAITFLWGSQMAWSRTKIIYWAWDLQADLAVKLEKPFEEKYPDIDLEIVKMGIWNVHDKLSVVLAAGTGAPDVSQLTLRRFTDFSVTGELLDLTDRFRKYEGKFVAPSWEGVKYKGRLYALPITSTPGIIYYRKDILDQFNIKPEDLKTWDSIIRIGKNITDEKAGRYMTFLSSPAEAYAADPWVMYITSMGGNVFDEQGNLIRNNKTAEKAFKFWYDLVYTHKIAKLEPFGRPAFWSFVKSNNLVMFPWSVPILGTLKTQVPEQSGKWRALAWPMLPGQSAPQVGDFGGTVLTVPKQTKNVDAVITWMEYLCTSMEGTKGTYQQTGSLPAYKPALEASFMKEPDPYLGGQVRIDIVNSQKAFPFNYFHWTEGSSIIGSQLDAMLARQKTPEQAWQDAENLLYSKVKGETKK